MIAKVHHMLYAANLGFGRHRCVKCNEETMHKGNACIHCGTVFEVAIPPNLSPVDLRAQINSRNHQIAQSRKRQAS